MKESFFLDQNQRKLSLTFSKVGRHLKYPLNTATRKQLTWIISELLQQLLGSGDASLVSETTIDVQYDISVVSHNMLLVGSRLPTNFVI